MGPVTLELLIEKHYHLVFDPNTTRMVMTIFINPKLMSLICYSKEKYKYSHMKCSICG